MQQGPSRTSERSLVRRAGLALAALALIIALVALLVQRSRHAAPSQLVVISCASVGLELELCQEGAERWSRQTKIPVQVVTAPSDSGERLGLYILLLAAHSPDIDVFSVDTTWSGIMSDFFLDLGPSVDSSLKTDAFPGFLQNNTVDGRLVALPWYIDAGLLYYRRDLLDRYHQKVPKSWEELTQVAELVQQKERDAGNASLWGFVFQGRAYEGLTCNALEWIASFGGGTIVDASGKVTINNPQAAAALRLSASWIGKIAPLGVLNYAEEESRGVFQSGNAVFMRNWPYAWKLANSADSPVRGKVGVTLLPRGHDSSTSAATLGGWSLAVSKYSRHTNAAVSLVKFLSSPEEQRRRLAKGGFFPTWQSLYSEPELLRENPLMASLQSVFLSALPRPSQVTKTYYNRVSTEFLESVHRVLAGEEPVESALKRLSESLTRIGRGGQW